MPTRAGRVRITMEAPPVDRMPPETQAALRASMKEMQKSFFTGQRSGSGGAYTAVVGTILTRQIVLEPLLEACPVLLRRTAAASRHPVMPHCSDATTHAATRGFHHRPIRTFQPCSFARPWRGECAAHSFLPAPCRLVTDWWDFPKGKTRSVEPAVPAPCQ